MKIVLNPFSKEKIAATNSTPRVLKMIAEGAANNPLTTALVLTGAAGILRAGTRVVVGQITGATAAKADILAITGTAAGQIATNTVTQKLTSNLLVKAGFTVAAVFMIEKIASTYPFAKFEISEALQALGIARWQATEAGRGDLVEGLDQLQEEILNPEGWENVISKTPYINIIRAAQKNIDAAVASTAVFNKLIKDKEENPEEDFEARLTRIREEELEMDKANVDYYNDERKKMLKFEEEAADRDMKEDAKFWAAERAKQRKKEAEDRQAIADFWSAYRKTAQRLNDNSRPSNLNFGLL